MNTVTAAIQGSGWGWLGYNTDTKKLEIVTTANQDPLLSHIPIIGIDIWEHAFYLQYHNVKADVSASLVYLECSGVLMSSACSTSRLSGTLSTSRRPSAASSRLRSRLFNSCVLSEKRAYTERRGRRNYLYLMDVAVIRNCSYAITACRLAMRSSRVPLINARQRHNIDFV